MSWRLLTSTKVVKKLFAIAVILDFVLFSKAYELNVKTDCNATGNGGTDDTDAIKYCLNKLKSTADNGFGGTLYFPPGNYLVLSKIEITDSFPSRTYICGDGWSSAILWAFNDNLFEFNSNVGVVDKLTIRDLVVLSSTVEKDDTSAAFYFNCNITYSLFDHILLSAGDVFFPSGIIMKDRVDTVTFNDMLIFLITGTGIEIGWGAEVRITGGRIAGKTNFEEGVGIHITGNNGGVHIENTDVIGLNQGLIIDSSNGHASNREVFITQATFDSCNYGILIYDNTYVDIEGIWAASSDYDQVWVAVDANPLLVMNGGTIFNGGAHGLSKNASSIDCTVQCNGIVVNGGTFILNNVVIRNNNGKGIWIPNDAVNDYIISGNKIYGNGIGYQYLNPSDVKKKFVNNLCTDNEFDVINQMFPNNKITCDQEEANNSLILTNLVNGLVEKKYQGLLESRSQYLQDGQEPKFVQLTQKDNPTNNNNNSNTMLVLVSLLLGCTLTLMVMSLLSKSKTKGYTNNYNDSTPLLNSDNSYVAV